MILAELKELVVFAILMEHGEGIVDKSPLYIEEKYKSALTADLPETLLDPNGQAKLQRWLDRWGPK